MNNHFVISWMSALAQATVLVVLAWPLVVGARRRSAARFSTVCRLVMAGAVVLAPAVFVLSAWPAADGAGPAEVAVARSVSRLPAESDEAAMALWRENGEIRSSGSSPAVEAESSRTVFSFVPRWTIDPVVGRRFGWLWLAGVGAVALPWLRGRWVRASLWRQSHAVADDDPLAVAIRVSDVVPACRVRVHEGPVTPCVWGLWRPVLLLPVAACDWPLERLRLVLAHEGEHLRRRDPWWRCLAGVFLALLWFHPLAWSLARRARQADERAADDAVLACEGDAPAYAETLLDCARLFAAPAPLERAAFTMAGPGGLPARVRAVLDERRDRRAAGAGTWAGGLLLVGVVAGLAAIGAPRLVAAEAEEEASVVEMVEKDEEDQKKEEEQKDDGDGKAASSAWTPVEIGERVYLRASEVGAFYKFPSVGVDAAGEMIFKSPKLVMRWKTSPRALHMNGIKFRTLRPWERHEGEWMISREDLTRIVDPVLRPRHIKNAEPPKTIILDPGHGGRDSGATSGGGSEAAFSLDVARRLRPLLEKAGFTVRLTREDDRFVTLSDRAAVAEGVTEGAVISLHFNSSRLPEDQGVQTGFPAVGLGHDEHLGAAVALATAVQASCLHQLKAPDAGVMAVEFGLMRRLIHLPVIFINGGNLSFDEEAAAIATEAYRERLAVAIASGVVTYRHAITGRPPQ